MNTESVHLLAELHDCDPAALDDAEALLLLMERAVTAAGATIINRTAHRFAPQGVSIVIVIEESHFSIHTWPEVGYAAADFFTCGDCRPDGAVAILAAGVRALRTEIVRVMRGRAGGLRLPVPRVIDVSHHSIHIPND